MHSESEGEEPSASRRRAPRLSARQRRRRPVRRRRRTSDAQRLRRSSGPRWLWRCVTPSCWSPTAIVRGLLGPREGRPHLGPPPAQQRRRGRADSRRLRASSTSAAGPGCPGSRSPWPARPAGCVLRRAAGPPVRLPRRRSSPSWGSAIECTVVRGRAPEVAAASSLFSAITSIARAVAPLERLVSWTMPLVRPGGAVAGVTWRARRAGAARGRTGARAARRPEPQRWSSWVTHLLGDAGTRGAGPADGAVQRKGESRVRGQRAAAAEARCFT